MPRYIITETEEEKQFLVKNMFSLYRNKITGCLKYLDQNGELLLVNPDDNIFKQTDRQIIFKNENLSRLILVCFNKRNKYKIYRHKTFALHHRCFDELTEWLKDKQDSGYTL
jgi:hypothetical protein